jgi:hypothetical protein
LVVVEVLLEVEVTEEVVVAVARTSLPVSVAELVLDWKEALVTVCAWSVDVCVVVDIEPTVVVAR